ncbi:MAG: hypothetical protein VB858_07545 [Planctomycetaceae bacterium]
MRTKSAVLNPVVLAFIAGAVVSWGLYVPVVHKAARLLDSKLSAFLFVGVAYFLVAVLVPAILIFLCQYDPTAKASPNFRPGPVGWGIAAGAAGAIGALCVIMAATNAGKGGVLFVAPLVFAGAPIVNTIATITWFHPVKKLPDWKFFLGLMLAAAGAGLVMIFKGGPAEASASSVFSLNVLGFVAGAVLSWGLYVPVVHEAAIKLHSNLRAFLFVGVAYFLVAVVVPATMIFGLSHDPTSGPDPNFAAAAMGWGIAAGVAGAAGALCVIFAVTNAGKGGALYVAPLVFAGAPVINTIATITYFHKPEKLPEAPFYFGLLMAAGGAAMVMIFKPKLAPPAQVPSQEISAEAASD